MSATSGTETAEVLQTLTRILEHADALRARGCSPRIALGTALFVHKPRLGLALVAKAAWALAVGTDALSATLRGSNDPSLSAASDEPEDDASSRRVSSPRDPASPAPDVTSRGTGSPRVRS